MTKAYRFLKWKVIKRSQYVKHMESAFMTWLIPEMKCWFCFSGADDLMKQQDFAKELGNAITGMPDGFDTDLFPSVEALKGGLDPLDLQDLQMLTDPNNPNNITDPATEESFKLDRL